MRNEQGQFEREPEPLYPIECPKCGKTISGMNTNCPHCNRNIEYV
jgi:uncharacterized OB-fold protein